MQKPQSAQEKGELHQLSRSGAGGVPADVVMGSCFLRIDVQLCSGKPHQVKQGHLSFFLLGFILVSAVVLQHEERQVSHIKLTGFLVSLLNFLPRWAFKTRQMIRVRQRFCACTSPVSGTG